MVESSESVSFFFKIIWVAYLVLAPFYVLQSGYPQPADFVLLLGLAPALGLAALKSEVRIPTAILLGIGFVVLTFTINIIHFVFTSDLKFLLSSLYYVYNFGVFLFALQLFKLAPQTINHLTYWALAASICIETVFILLDYGSSIRTQGTFNNPNQLGYWSLLSFALLIIIKRHERLTLMDAALILMMFVTQLVSLSKAGIVSMAFCLLIVFFSRLMSDTSRLFLIGIVSVGLAFMLITQNDLLSKVADFKLIDTVYTRISTIGAQGDDSLRGRGYDRILDNPHYVLLGAGEGANWRYNPQGKELHSGLATLLFSYGIVGFLLFFTFLFFVFRGRPWRYIFLLVPIMMYGLTHQNIRFTYFWVVIAAAYSGCHFEQRAGMYKPTLLTDDSDVGKAPPRQHAS
ncbi:MAG TPA: hypothetical protein PK513_01630 [Alphaproteobacteria bacterium]|nr:hypothetical protein [Alphaproteobacteria bacterium]USO06564.1 MAG: hypothetical protein H6859_05200 [Rhodospirillales bacterium]HOO81184.1 hypothetical protein [Alphaproteobacteria bacterium]